MVMSRLLAALNPLRVYRRRPRELRRPLGIAIVGGLIGSQLLTLYTTPVVYLALERLRSKHSAHHGAPPSAVEGPQGEPAPAE